MGLVVMFAGVDCVSREQWQRGYLYSELLNETLKAARSDARK
jgi:hypothetical protein